MIDWDFIKEILKDMPTIFIVTFSILGLVCLIVALIISVACILLGCGIK